MQVAPRGFHLYPLFIIIFMDTLGLSLVIPLLSPLLMEPGTSIVSYDISVQTRNFLYGLTLGVYSLATFFGAPILGDLSDRIGRKRVLFICILGTFVGYVVAVYAVISKLYGLFLISRLIDGFTAGSLAIAQAVVVDVSPHEAKTSNIGKVLFAATLGYVMGPILGGFLSDAHILPWFTLSTPLFFAAFLAIVNALWLQLSFRESYPRIPETKIKLLGGLAVLKQAFSIKTIRHLAVLFLLLQLGWAAYSQFIAYFLVKRYAFSPPSVGVFLALLGIGYGVAFLYLVRKLTAKYSLPYLTRLAFGVMSVMVLITAISNHVWVAWLIAVPAAIGLALGYAVLISRFSDQVDPSKQGRIMGLTGAISAFSFAVIGITEGLLTGTSLAAPMWTAFIGLVLGFILSLKRG